MCENEMRAAVEQYVEPVFRYCLKRLNRREDAEDLAGDILLHVLEGIGKYKIESLDAWVWRIARNRYARFLDERNKNPVTLWGNAVPEIADESPFPPEEDDFEAKYASVFSALHTLSAGYRDLFVDYYIGELSVKELARKYALTESTVKWRLNVSRQKIRERMEENTMEKKIYSRLNWDTETCNGSCSPDTYLHTQLARAICEACYEKPLTVEEISLATGIPALYIEDELPRLEYGEAVQKIGQKWGTNFIILHLKDRELLNQESAPVVSALADEMEKALRDGENKLAGMEFYGHDFGIARLGYAAAAYRLRQKLFGQTAFQNRSLAYPPRQDGGYGWFLVSETSDKQEGDSDGYESICNCASDDSENGGTLYYHSCVKYFVNPGVYRDGTVWLIDKRLPMDYPDGHVPHDTIDDEHAVRLIQNNLLEKDGDGWKFRFPCFTGAQFKGFADAFDFADECADSLLAEWTEKKLAAFRKFVPKRLEDQIFQYACFDAAGIVWTVIDELIRRGVLASPPEDKPLTDGVFFIAGKYINL